MTNGRSFTAAQPATKNTECQKTLRTVCFVATRKLRQCSEHVRASGMGNSDRRSHPGCRADRSKNYGGFMSTMRDEFERWLLDEQGLVGDCSEERNIYDQFPAHLAWKAWQAACNHATPNQWTPCAEPDLLWDADNPEESGQESAYELASYCAQDMPADESWTVDVMCAKRLPNRQMRIWVDDNEELQWDWVAPTAQKEGE